MIYVEFDDKHNGPTIYSYDSIEDFFDKNSELAEERDLVEGELFDDEGSGYYSNGEEYTVLNAEKIRKRIRDELLWIEVMEKGLSASDFYRIRRERTGR